MLDLTTQYLGLELPHPLMPGASPLSDSLDGVRRLEDAGAPVIVLRSLFEEQLASEQLATHRAIMSHVDSFVEALTFLPDPDAYVLGPEQYLEHLAAVKRAVAVPVIASLNGTTEGGWLRYAKLIEEAGADALELNVYDLPQRTQVNALDVERSLCDLVAELRQTTALPLAVKLTPYYSSLPHFVAMLIKSGADGLILFNRLYQPDIDVEALEMKSVNPLSDSRDLLPRLRWLGVLSPQFKNVTFACSGGVHTPIDVVKAVMAGAHGVQMVSALLKHGPNYLADVLRVFRQWMEEHQYDSLDVLRGSMNVARCPEPAMYARSHYIQTLQTWK
jgi:dihydroorotate dehydrogenase (fumarate)